MKKLIMVAMVLSMCIAASGCNDKDPFFQAWYNVYGDYCGHGDPTPGCNFYSNGTKIRDSQDPYYTNRTLSFSLLWTYTDSYGQTQYYSGFAWQSPTGILYDSDGNALNELGQSDSHDLLGDAAERETKAIEASGRILVSQYSDGSANALSEDQGIRIAQTLNDWAVLGKSRARTAHDTATFSQRLFGVNMDAAQAALQSAQTGKPQALQDLNRQVAAYWGTNPETTQAILSSWYTDIAKSLR